MMCLFDGAGSMVTPDAPLMSSGLDSLGAVELRNSLEAALGMKLSATLVSGCPPLLTVGMKLLGIMGVCLPPLARPSPLVKLLPSLPHPYHFTIQVFDYPTIEALSQHLAGLSAPFKALATAAATSPANVPPLQGSRRQALLQQYGLQASRPALRPSTALQRGPLGAPSAFSSRGQTAKALICIESLVERSPFTGADQAAALQASLRLDGGGGVHRADPVGLVPLQRWDVEGGEHPQATAARFGAYLSAIDRFDAQVRGNVGLYTNRGS